MEGIVDGCVFDEGHYFSLGWKYGPPRGIMFHYIGEDGQRNDTLNDYGASVHFSISQNPEKQPTIQRVNLLNRSWHCYEPSDYYFGIEHFVDLDNIDFTEAQLVESARISAEIVMFAKQKWGVTIPLVRAPGAGFSPGFKEHRDGLGNDWNRLLHSDGLVKRWAWAKYIEVVKQNIEEDDMALFENKEDFRDETLKALVGYDREGNPNVSQDEFLNAVRFTLGMDLRMKGDSRPTKMDSIQKGWDFAEKMMKIDLEDWTNDLPKGKISGIVTFEQS